MGGGGAGGVVAGADVIVAYRRTRAGMPADPEEIDAALAEGIRVEELVAPVRVLNDGQRVTGLVCVRMRLTEPDQSGRPRPIPVEGSEHTLSFDSVIVGIGQRPLLDFLADSGVARRRDGRVIADPETMETSLPGVFAGGDAVRGPATVICAVADGRCAAEQIMARYAPSPGRKPPVDEEGQPLGFGELIERRSRRAYRRLRQRLTERPPRNLDPLPFPVGAADARAEAERCLRCDLLCSLCETVCPNRAMRTYEVEPLEGAYPRWAVEEGALRPAGERLVTVQQGYQVVNIANFCNECGNCATFCPTQGAPYRDKPRLHLDRQSFDLESEGALFIEAGEDARMIYWKGPEGLRRLRKDRQRIRFESPALGLTLAAEDLQVLEAVAGPAAREDELLDCRECLELLVLLEGLTRSFPQVLDTSPRRECP